MNALIARSGAARVDWVGTSLGGLIGLTLAGFPGHPIRRLVINDIGPVVPASGLQRIGQYVAEMPIAFDTLEDAERYLRKVLAPFGTLEDEHWRHLTRHSVRLDPADRAAISPCAIRRSRTRSTVAEPGRSPVGLLGCHRRADPGRPRPGFRSPAVLLAQEMARRNPRMLLHDVPGCGHAPTLMTPDQIEAVPAFLMRTRTALPAARPRCGSGSKACNR